MTKQNPGDWHYPGNWHVERLNGFHKVCDEQGVTVADIPVHPLDPPEWAEANADLIAAAPEMYDLLAEINQTFYVDGTSKALKAVMAKTKPLLSKARGQT
jgi:hypothetical protein